MPTKTTPSAPVDQLKSAGDAVVGSLRETQRFALDAAGKWIDALTGAVPMLPALPALPGVPTKHDVETVIAASFGFAQELLAVQKELAEGLLAVVPTPATAPATASAAA
jgi:hypothetical protein